MEIQLLRVNPTVKKNKHPMAFVDFAITFTGGEQIIIKGAIARFYKNELQLMVPKLKHSDPDKHCYSPFLFGKIEDLLEFKEKGLKLIMEKHPLSKWEQGSYDGEKNGL